MSFDNEPTWKPRSQPQRRAQRRAPKAPAELAAAGAELWRNVRRDFDLRPDEIEYLLNACRTLDELKRIEQQLANEAIFSKGSRGQRVANPLLGEARAHRREFTAQMKALGLRDAADPDAALHSLSSSGGRQLALARWNRA